MDTRYLIVPSTNAGKGWQYTVQVVGIASIWLLFGVGWGLDTIKAAQNFLAIPAPTIGQEIWGSFSVGWRLIATIGNFLMVAHLYSKR